ncbi:MAG: efflux RND transporter periplasmic adaptor subunit [Planctomycetota bacterium]|jgi:multidrug efflux pump subunit AcrA (membrane-fusion protein)
MAAKRNIVIAAITRVVICIALLGTAAVVFRHLVLTRVSPQPEDAARGAPPVSVMVARAIEVRRQYVGYGTARSMDSADIPARVSATVERIPEAVEPGAVVSAGDLIAELDRADFERQVEVSNAVMAELDAQLLRLDVEEASWKERTNLASEEVELAEAEYERVRGALERDAAKQREVDQARQALIQAIRVQVGATEERDKIPARRAGLQALKASHEATLRLAQQGVDRCRIVSPIEGVLQEVDVEVGENLAAGQRVARVVSIERVEVGLRLASSARPDVAVGDPVELRSAGALAHGWSALVTRIAPEDDPSTRTMTVYIEVRQSRLDEVTLSPGMFLEGTVTSSRRALRWLVPRRSMQNNRITLVEDGIVTSREVEVDFHLEAPLPQLGVPDTQWLVLERPLDEEAKVVLTPSRQLTDGTRVVPVAALDTVAANDPGPSASAPGDGGEEAR